jgi:hypothetical protein
MVKVFKENTSHMSLSSFITLYIESQKENLEFEPI